MCGTDAKETKIEYNKESKRIYEAKQWMIGKEKG
jgi:hypothetical protein